MDGKENENIFIIGATNMKETLDKALLRPGRFDLVIELKSPEKKSRKKLFNYYLSKV